MKLRKLAIFVLALVMALPLIASAETAYPETVKFAAIYGFTGSNATTANYNQKKMLEDYARRNGLPNPTHFTDDGVSGTRFDRPGFLAMMEEVEAGRVEAVVIKDMSRLGRDYLKVGQVMEILRQRGVRLIAINDGVDSLKGDDDFTPFRNIMNDNLE